MTEDEQEALSIKYTAGGVVALSSGNLAVFSHFSNKDGLSLLCICPPDQLWERLREIQADNTVVETFYVMPKESPMAGVLAALIKPVEPMRRRV